VKDVSHVKEWRHFRINMDTKAIYQYNQQDKMIHLSLISGIWHPSIYVFLDLYVASINKYVLD